VPASGDVRRAQAGFTLAEAMIVVIVLGLLASMAWPRFDVACEATRAEDASAVLRSVWLAQRMHWLEHGTFADSLQDLSDQHLLDKVVPGLTQPFTYTVLSADNTGFAVQAQRAGSQEWSGTLVLDETGELSGQLQDGKGHHVVPAL